MNSNAIKICFAATFGGSLIFVCLVGFSILTSQFNADTMPNFPWFPIPVLGVVFGVAWWCDRRWDIGLRTACKAPMGLVVAFAITSNVAAHALWLLEKAWHGTVYAAPAGPPNVSAMFSATYWIAISIAMSTSSEVCFRGIMQSQLARHVSAWSAILIVIFFNTISHPWATLWPRFFGVLAILFAWGWLRHISGSLRVCIVTHLAAVMLGDVVFYFTGPVDFGQVSTAALAVITAVGLLALGASVALSRSITTR